MEELLLNVPLWYWIAFISFVIVMLLIDLVFFHRRAHEVTMKEAVAWVTVWVSLAMIFNVFIWVKYGQEAGMMFLTGYLIEESLSVDNLFVFLLIFSSFHIPHKYQHEVLFYGILGAIIMRGLFIFLGIALIHKFEWIFFVFGLILLYAAYKMAFRREQRFNAKKSVPVKIINAFGIPVAKKLHGQRFFVREKGKLTVTILFVALIVIELTDVVFAFDSIPAIFSITTDPFIVFTSNIFAVLGLRALYFVLSGLQEMFRYLKYGLTLVLGFIAVKLLLYKWAHIPVEFSLSFIALVLGASILLSVIRRK